MIDTKMIANTKKNTPFDIIWQIQRYKQIMSIKNYQIHISKLQWCVHFLITSNPLTSRQYTTIIKQTEGM
jgi:hypothetical protein